MDKILKSILVKLEEAGFEAYLVGGFVRDYLLGIKSLDIDICTNALPKDLYKLFPGNTANNYGGCNFQIRKYNVDITTYRKELKYNKRKPTEIVYIKTLEEDIKRRDFTINTICMDKDEKIIDLLNGITDLNNHTIKMLGDINAKLHEDALRILRAVRFATILDFNIDDKLYKKLQENYKLVGTLSKMRIKQELTKILLHPNFQKGLDILRNLKILDLLNINYEDVTYVKDICGMWAQLELSEDLGFTKQERRNIINIRQIVKDGFIDNKTLFTYGLYTSQIAAEILNIPKQKITKMYNKLPIKFPKDLDISTEEIIELLEIEPSKKVKNIQNELITLILENKIPNINSTLRKYILKRKE